ncbi:hypothetical protein HU200_030812 [Digitaria exilis]|uniref:Uncharacterized protein n=1 Tax=Digitaria exilis TaxID=1010633 RepID=A0A835C2V1_9POAL|nr:hypothetical protein HU200_030812 [Digitaria exilis]
MATVQPQSPAGPTPPPPQEGQHADAPDQPAAVAAGPGGEIAALDKQLAVGGGAGEERKPGGGGKLVAEAMRKYAAPRSSRFHGVTRCGLVAKQLFLKRYFVIPGCNQLSLITICTNRRKDGKWQARIGRIGESRDTKDIYLGTFGAYSSLPI